MRKTATWLFFLFALVRAGIAYAYSKQTQIGIAESFVATFHGTSTASNEGQPDLVLGFRAADLEGLDRFGFLTPNQVGVSKRTYRDRLEKNMYGFSPAELKTLAPKYAHFFDASDERRLLSTYYGTTYAKLKPSLLKRTMVTSGDSSADGFWDLSPAMETRKVKSSRSTGYSEAQILGPVDLHDVEAIYLSPEDFSQRDLVLKLAKKYGFKAYARFDPLGDQQTTHMRNVRPLEEVQSPAAAAAPLADFAEVEEKWTTQQIADDLRKQNELYETGKGTPEEIRELKKMLRESILSADAPLISRKNAAGIYQRLKLSDPELDSVVGQLQAGGNVKPNFTRRPAKLVASELAIANLDLNDPFQAIDILMRNEAEAPLNTLLSFYQKYVNFATALGAPPLTPPQVDFLARGWFRRYFHGNLIEPDGRVAAFFHEVPELRPAVLKNLAREIRSPSFPTDINEFHLRWNDGWEGFNALKATPKELEDFGLIDAFKAKPSSVALETLGFISQNLSTKAPGLYLDLAELVPPKELSIGGLRGLSAIASRIIDMPLNPEEAKALARRIWKVAGAHEQSLYPLTRAHASELSSIRREISYYLKGDPLFAPAPGNADKKGGQPNPSHAPNCGPMFCKVSPGPGC